MLHSLVDFQPLLNLAAAWSATRPRLFHFRTETGNEVDFVLEDSQGRCVGIEVKAGTAHPAAAKGLCLLADALGRRFVRGVVLHTGRDTVPFGRKLHALPIQALWQLRSKI